MFAVIIILRDFRLGLGVEMAAGGRADTEVLTSPGAYPPRILPI